MPDRRGKRGSCDVLLPNSRKWAEEIWRDREDVAKINSGGWMIRHAADLLGLDRELVDDLLRRTEHNRQ